MKIETLIEICRPGELKNYKPLQDWGMHDCNIDLTTIKKYEIVEEDFLMSGSGSYLNDSGYYYIIKNTETGEYFEVQVGHDSWSDNLVESFRSPVITKVEPKEVTIIEYDGNVKAYLEDL